MTLHFDPFAKGAEQLLWAEKSLVAETLVIVSDDAFTLVTEMVCETLVPINCKVEKLRLIGLKARFDPVPTSCAVWGLLESLSCTVMVPVRGPVPAGANVMFTLQLSSTPSEGGQLFVSGNSLVEEILWMASGAVPKFETKISLRRWWCQPLGIPWTSAQWKGWGNRAAGESAVGVEPA